MIKTHLGWTKSFTIQLIWFQLQCHTTFVMVITYINVYHNSITLSLYIYNSYQQTRYSSKITSNLSQPLTTMCWNLGPKPSNLPGFNTYSASSELGTRVVVLQRGAAFGETGQPKESMGRWKVKLSPPELFTDMARYAGSFPPFESMWIYIYIYMYITLEIMG